jgi:acyl-ACP thioesterase
VSAPEIWKERFRVRSYEVEPDGRLRIVVLARMLQEAAWQHAHRLGKGFAERESGALFWVLSRLRVRMDRYPRWGDEFTIRTWPVGTDRLLAIREFVLDDDQGTLGRVASGWLVVDGTTGRPVRPEKLVGDLHVSASEFDGDLLKLGALADIEPGEVQAVQFHDIDQYRHANNTAYLEWMIDAIAARADGGTGLPGAGDGGIAPIHELSINFLKELVAGENYRTRIADAASTIECEILRATDEAAICRARMTWKPERMPSMTVQTRAISADSGR